MSEILNGLINGYAQATLEELKVLGGKPLKDKEFLYGYVLGFKSGYAESIGEFEMPLIETPTWSFYKGKSLGEREGRYEGLKQQMNEDLSGTGYTR
jgi:hypothetical protein